MDKHGNKFGFGGTREIIGGVGRSHRFVSLNYAIKDSFLLFPLFFSFFTLIGVVK